MIYKQIDYARQCIEDKRYDMLLDALDDIEYQAKQTVSRIYHEEQMMAKNIEMKMTEPCPQNPRQRRIPRPRRLVFDHGKHVRG